MEENTVQLVKRQENEWVHCILFVWKKKKISLRILQPTENVRAVFRFDIFFFFQARFSIVTECKFVALMW